MTSNSPVQVVPLRPVACGAVVWRFKARLRVTVVVKATFGLVHGGVARLVAPAPLALADRPRGGAPHASLEAATELAPYLPCAGVVAIATAHAPHGSSVGAAAVALRIGGERPLVDKTLHVYGDRASPDAPPAPFASMPIAWERAVGGAGVAENPVGVGAGDGAPNVVDPLEPTRPAGFGPLAPTWAPRATRQAPPPGRVPASLDLPEGFDFSYFQSAPSDQWLPFLRGDEWIALDGMHPTLPRLETRLPSATARARWSVPGDARVSSIELAADTLALDVERQLGSVVWRGHFVVERVETLAELRVLAGIELPGYAIPWPEGSREATPAPSGPTSLVEDAPTTQTRPSPFARLEEPSAAGATTADVPSPFREIAPFALAPPRAAPAVIGPPIPGAPWSAEPASPVPEPSSQPDAATVLIPSPFAGEPFAPPPPSGEPAVAADSPEAPPLAPSASPARSDSLRAELVDATREGRSVAHLALAGANLSGLDLAGAKLAGVNLAGADLGGANLVGADLDRADLARAILAGADLTGASLVDAKLDEAKAPGAILRNARAPELRARGAELDDAVLDGLDAPGAVFEKASLARASFTDARLRDAVLTRANCAGASFRGADLDGASLQRLAAAGADFSGAKLRSADLRQSRAADARFDGADLRQANLARSELGGARFDHADLTAASFREGRLRGASFVKATLTGADLRDTDLADADLRGASLAGAKLAGADRTDAREGAAPDDP